MMSILYSSEKEFLKSYRQMYQGKEEVRFLYQKLLTELHQSILDGNIDNLKKVTSLINHVTKGEKQTKLQNYYENNNHTLGSKNVIILACKSNRDKILKCLLSNHCNILHNLTTNIGRNLFLPSDLDESHHSAFYYAIRSGNTSLFETLINEWPGDNCTDHLNELDEIISKAYEELKLKLFPLPKEMQILVEEKLINLRFFSHSSGNIQDISADHKCLKERIRFLLENVELLREEFFNKKEVDDKFIFVAKIIAQNIHILKRQLKLTYSKIPWEEMEFCLICFVSSQVMFQEGNIFYSAVLSKDRILYHLRNFSRILAKESDWFLKQQNVNPTKLPNLSREKVVAKIVKSSPEFEELYSDYQEVRDFHSFEKMNGYIEVVSVSDCNEKEGQLILMRTLQVVGEHLKNTLESPKLSKSACDLLLLSLPRNTRKVCVALRNSLSHVYSLAKRLEIEKSTNCNFFTSVQEDIKSLGKVIADVLLMRKFRKMKQIMKGLLDCKTLNEIRKVVAVVNNIRLENMVSGGVPVTERQKLKQLVDRLDSIIPDKTDCVKKLFDKIRSIIDSEEMEFSKHTDYRMMLSVLKGTSILINKTKFDHNDMRIMKYSVSKVLGNMTPEMSNEDSKEIALLVVKISSFVLGRAQENFRYIEEVRKVVLEIFYIAKCGMDGISSVAELKEKLYVTFSERTSNDNRIKKDKCKRLLEENIYELNCILNKYSLSGNNVKKCLYQENNRTLQVAVEMLVLDIMSILDDLKNSLQYDQLFLDDHVPLLVGKSLRNHLAHNNAIMELLLTSPSLLVLLNAKKIVSENVIDNEQKIGKLVKNDTRKLSEKFDEQLAHVVNQQESFNAIKEGNLENLRRCIVKGADLGGRDINFWSAAHHAAEGRYLEVVKFLFAQKLNMNLKDHFGRSPLHIAAVNGSTEIVEFFIDEVGLPVDVADENRQTPLHMAAQNGHKDVVEFLLKKNANVMSRDLLQKMPVHYAVCNNHIDVVGILVKSVVCIEVYEAVAGLNLLHIAAENGYLKLVQLLLKKYENVNMKSEQGAIPLHLAALNGHTEVVKTLIVHGSEVNATDMNGCSPLHFAADNGHAEIVNILIKNGASVNVCDFTERYTPLIYAASDGYGNIVDMLLSSRANCNISTCAGLTPLHFASLNGHLKIVVSLLKNGANPIVKDIFNQSPLFMAARTGQKEIVKILLEHGAMVNSEVRDGNTPLHASADGGYEEIVELLIANKAIIDAQNSTGRTALHQAAVNGFKGIVSCLFKSKADVNVRDRFGFEPLHLAALSGCMDSVGLLLASGAEVNSRGIFGFSPLHMAAMNGHSQICDFLIRNKAEVNGNPIGVSPAKIAVENGHKEVVELLIANGSTVDTLLSLAVKCEHRDIVKVLLESGADVKAEGSKALSIAALRGDKQTVDILLKHNADVNAAHCSALYFAVKRGHIDVVRTLLKRGAEANSLVSCNITPLHAAACNASESIVKILIAHGANVNFRCADGQTPLHLASGQGHEGVVKVLLDSNATINAKDGKGRTSLELAVAHNHWPVVKLLLSHEGVDVNAKGNDGLTLLHIAVGVGNLDMIKSLINFGCNIHARNDSGSKPIHHAAREGFKEIIDFFISRGCCIHDRGCGDQSLLHYAAVGGHEEVIEYLLALGLDVNGKDKNGFTSLHTAVQLGHKNAVVALLNKGAIFNAVDKFKRKPLHLAYIRDVCNLLISTQKLFRSVKHCDSLEMQNCLAEGASVNAKDNEGWTPLHYGAWKGDSAIVESLLQNNSDPNAVDCKGFTPLHYAAKFSHATIVNKLLFSGAIFNPSSNSGQTPLNLAVNKSIIYLLKLLENCFRKVEDGRRRIINDLNKIKSIDTVKAVMRACNRGNKTLIVAAVHCNFSEVQSLKNVFYSDSLEAFYTAEKFAHVGDYAQALAVYKALYKKRNELFGPDNPASLDVQIAIGKVLYKQGNYSRALRLFQEIGQKLKILFGSDNKDVLNVQSSIALILHRRGENEEALKLFNIVYPKQKQILGENDSDTLNTEFHMALVLADLGKHEEALIINEAAFELRKRKFGADNPVTLNAQNNVALVLFHMGRSEEALQIFKEVLKRKTSSLGAFHPDTLRTLNLIGAVLMRAEKFHEALLTFKYAFRIERNVLGPNHPNTLMSQGNMGFIFFHQGKLISAYKMIREFVSSGRFVFGSTHPYIIKSSMILKCISKVFQYRGDLLHLLSSCIHSAANNGDLKTIVLLLSGGADPDETDEEGRTAIHFAASNGHNHVVRALIAKKADVTHVTNKGNTALHLAASRGKCGVIETILNHVTRNKLIDFINKQTTVGKATAVHIAAKNGFLNILLCLLKHGAIYNMMDKEGKIPLDLAEEVSVIHFLNMVQELFHGTQKGCVSVIDKLEALSEAEFLAVSHARERCGRTLLQTAAIFEHGNIATRMIAMLKK